MSAKNRCGFISVDSDSDWSDGFSVSDEGVSSNTGIRELIQSNFEEFDAGFSARIIDLSLPETSKEGCVLKNSNIDNTTHANKRRKANCVSKEEKEKLKAEKERERIRKKEAKDLLKRVQPATCMQYVTVKVDENLFESVFGAEIIQSISQYGSRPDICKQDISHTITWTTKVIEDGIEVDKEAAPVLIIWDEAQFANLMLEESIVNRISSMQEKMPNKKFTLVIFGMESLLKELDKVDKDQFRRSVLGTETKRKRKLPKKYENINFLSRSVVEDIFVDLQLLNECCTRVADTTKDIGCIVLNFTKAIAETPYKLEKQKQQVDGLGWLATCDPRDCVRVNKSGNGLKQLWLQQLMQFNNSGLDIAQAIVEKYPTPLVLYKAYCKCDTSKKGEELLKDIIVRRGFGEAAAKRRVGPELSKKIYYFLTSLDGDLSLSQE